VREDRGWREGGKEMAGRVLVGRGDSTGADREDYEGWSEVVGTEKVKREVVMMMVVMITVVVRFLIVPLLDIYEYAYHMVGYGILIFSAGTGGLLILYTTSLRINHEKHSKLSILFILYIVS
jgi:hypothetical protein